MGEPEPLHPQDDAEDWPEVLRWLRENWELLDISERWALKRLLDRIAEVNQSERGEIAELDAEYAKKRQAVLDTHERRRERIRADFRRVTGVSE